MKRDLVKFLKLNSSFLASESELEIILKRLLVINTKDCLDIENSEVIEKKMKEMTVAKLIEEGYINFRPKINMTEHEEVKAYISISFDSFVENETNPFYRDCIINFDIICHTNYWYLGNYRLRPLKIAGIIDGLLNETHLVGIGLFNFIGCNELLLNEDLSGYTLSYRAIHGNEDYLEPNND